VAARATTVLPAMLQFAVSGRLLPSSPAGGVKVYEGQTMSVSWLTAGWRRPRRRRLS
jgi:hypothetical protein